MTDSGGRRWIFLAVLILCALPPTVVYLVFIFPGLAYIGFGLAQRWHWLYVHIAALFVFGGWGLTALWVAGIRHVVAERGSQNFSRNLLLGLIVGVSIAVFEIVAQMVFEETLPLIWTGFVVPPLIPAIYLLVESRTYSHSNNTMESDA